MIRLAERSIRSTFRYTDTLGPAVCTSSGDLLSITPLQLCRAQFMGVAAPDKWISMRSLIASVRIHWRTIVFVRLKSFYCNENTLLGSVKTQFVIFGSLSMKSWDADF